MSRKEFGDFQTPDALAREVCAHLAERGMRPRSLVEPTCGTGAFLSAAIGAFPKIERIVGADINAGYLKAAADSLNGSRERASFLARSFFEIDWPELLDQLPHPILVIGNPPWVTNAELGVLRSANLPSKSNFQKHRGLDARTGKSNFDISETILIRLIEALQDRDAELAMLCKTATARKVLAHAWRNGLRAGRAEIVAIDAARYFDVAVDACLLRIRFGGRAQHRALVYVALNSAEPSATLGFCDGELVADVTAYEKWKPVLQGGGDVWRSGIKHDCAELMEFRREGSRWRNGVGELVDLEDTMLFPLLKSSDVARGRTADRFLLVTQRRVGEDTTELARRVPKTWKYLQRHAARFAGRKSSIYRGAPPFSIFGVGPYTFSRWKVAVSGLYKSIRFAAIGPAGGKPVVFDDTCYFLPCKSRGEAIALAKLLNSPPAREALSAIIFPDAKRPVTAAVLRRLNLEALNVRGGGPISLRNGCNNNNSAPNKHEIRNSKSETNR